MTRRQVLWIEDNALGDVAGYAGPVYTSGRYDLRTALTATEGVQMICQARYDAVVIDIRLPPGSDDKWAALYRSSSSNPALARLGLHLLESLFAPTVAQIRLDRLPSWITPHRFGVLSVETEREIGDSLKRLQIMHLRTKTAGLHKTALLDLVTIIDGTNVET